MEIILVLHLPFTIHHLPSYIFLTKHLPGSALTRSRISKANNAPVRSVIEILVSLTSASICAGLSCVSTLNTDCSDADKPPGTIDRKSTRLNSSHLVISYA